MPEINEDIFHKIAYRIKRDGYFVYSHIIRDYKLNRSFKKSDLFQDFVKEKKLVRFGSCIWATAATVKLLKAGKMEVSVRKLRKGPITDIEIERKILTMHREFTPNTISNLIPGCRPNRVVPVVERMLEIGALTPVPQRDYFNKPRTFQNPFYLVTAYDRELVGGVALRHTGSKVDNIRFALHQFRKLDEPFNLGDLRKHVDPFPSFGYAELRRLIDSGYLSHDKATGYYEFIK